MRIRYDDKLFLFFVKETPQQEWSGLRRAECIESSRFGFTCEELDAAEAAPGTWIECEREEALPPSVRTKSDAIADLTEQRDALLEACKSTLPHLRHYYQLYPCEAVSLDIGSLVSAIATAKPGESK